MSSASSAALRRSLVRRATNTSITSATPRSFVLRHPSTFLPTTSRPLSRPLQHLTSTTSSTRHFTRSAIMSKGGVHNLGSKKDFDAALKEDSNLVVLDCFATWCGPCKAIAPQVVKFSDEFTDARFYKIDVDEVPDVAQELGIRAMPTFMLFKDGERVDEVVGANPNALRAAIEKHAK